MLETSFAEPFDIVWSRDAFMHIPDKPRLFSRLYQLLAPERPAGDHRLCPRQDAGLARVRALHRDDRLSRRRAERVWPALEAAGFRDVVVDDATARFIEILRARGDRLVTNRAEFLASFSEADLNYLVDRWAMKVRFCRAGDMKWGNYLARSKTALELRQDRPLAAVSF